MKLRNIFGKNRSNNREEVKEIIPEKEPQKVEAPPAPLTLERCNGSISLKECLICNRPGCCLCCVKASDIGPDESPERKAMKLTEKLRTKIEVGFTPDCGCLVKCRGRYTQFKIGFPVYDELGKTCGEWQSAVVVNLMAKRMGLEGAYFWCNRR